MHAPDPAAGDADGVIARSAGNPADAFAGNGDGVIARAAATPRRGSPKRKWRRRRAAAAKT
jgi:hypothetical protein